MKTKVNTRQSFVIMMTFIVTILTTVLLLPSCTENQAADIHKVNLDAGSNNPLLVLVGNDGSQSVCHYRAIDTSYVAEICRIIVEQGGGEIVFYAIGDNSDRTGIRCYIKHLPGEKEGLTISRRLEQKKKIEAVRVENERNLRSFLQAVQTEIDLVAGPDGKGSANTGLNQFFGKCETLLNEPQHQRYRRLVFVYSDGQESINGENRPSHHEFHTTAPFQLCLSGWKNEGPCDSIPITKFEDPQGFIDFLNKQILTNN